MEPLSIIIDNREQQPWHFGEHAKVKRGTLSVGDYALEGDHGFAVERKSLNDFVGTVSSGWRRFRGEIERARELQFPAFPIVVEARFEDLFPEEDGSLRYNHPNVLPTFLFKRIAEVTFLGGAVLFAGDPIRAAGLCWKILATRKAQTNE
jgi:hypothetical protein